MAKTEVPYEDNCDTNLDQPRGCLGYLRLAQSKEFAAIFSKETDSYKAQSDPFPNDEDPVRSSDCREAQLTVGAFLQHVCFYTCADIYERMCRVLRHYMIRRDFKSKDVPADRTLGERLPPLKPHLLSIPFGERQLELHSQLYKPLLEKFFIADPNALAHQKHIIVNEVVQR